MTKHVRATNTYNAIFQEYSPPGRSVIGRRPPNPPVNVESFDKGISCHVFAIASPITWDKAKAVNAQYSDVGGVKAIERAQARFDHEDEEQRKKRLNGLYVIQPFPEPSEDVRRQERTENMAQILAIRGLEATVLPVDNMYMCGGFREGQMVPEHMWVEDHTNNITYDTFINRNGIAVVEGVGVEGGDFRPGCEGHAFDATDIRRVKVEGYTWGQLIAIAGGAEKVGFPDSIKDTPQVLAAKMAIRDVETALAKSPDAGLTPEESEVLAKVARLQEAVNTVTIPQKTAQALQGEVNAVVTSLPEPEKLLHASALEKLKVEGLEKRRVAQAIVGLGPEVYIERVKLVQKANERIEATLAGIPEESVKNHIKKALERKRDAILAGDNPNVALDAFNKSMSDPNVRVLTKGIKDALKANENPVFKDDDPAKTTLPQQMKTMIASYVNNDGKLAELSLALTTTERIGATLAAIPEGSGARDFLKTALEKKREDILAGDTPAVALDAFNKSMSEGNITVLVQGINDGLTAIGTCKFGDGDGRLQNPFVSHMKKMMTSYATNDGKLAELSMKLTEVKDQLIAGPYADVLALTKRIQEMDLPKPIKNYAERLVACMRDLPLEQRTNFPNSKEQATFDALQTLLTTTKSEPQVVNESTLDLEQRVTEKLALINEDLDKRVLQAGAQI